MPMRLCHPRADTRYRVKGDGAAPTFWIPIGCIKAWMECLPSNAAHSTHVQSARQTSWHRLHDARCRCALSRSRSRPRQCPHAHSNGSKFPQKQISPYSNSDSNFVDQGGAGCAWVQDRGPRPATILPPLGVNQHTCCVRANLHMYHAPCAVLRYSGLLFGTGQRIACLAGLLRNKDRKATRKAKAVIALAQRDYRMARRPHG